jgi:PUA domain protein
MSKSQHRHYLRNKEVKKLLSEISREFKLNIKIIFGAKPRIEAIRILKSNLFLIENKPLLIEYDGRIYPCILFHEALGSFPKITVDKGALPHICNGADIMAPGIKGIDGDFSEGSIVILVDETYKKPISVGESLLSSIRMRSVKKGKVIKNIHYIGDRIWETLKSEGLLQNTTNLKT